MNPIERLEVLADELEKEGKTCVMFPDGAGNYHMADTELRAIIAELKQENERRWLKRQAEGEARVKRDEAVRKVAAELHLCANPGARNADDMRAWAARLRAALEGKHE